ncbi:MAG: MBL fold metallo-hydrolase [Eubacteriales bacterium]|nr:MBL fold metallo-hydrolase [Eubacteriales bacterium]
MERLIVLGTGNASVTKCYNTCFVLQDEKGRYFMVDAGGGNGVLTGLEKVRIPVTEIHDLFVSHKHTDHLLGVVWMIRIVGQQMQKGTYEGDFNIYCHDEVANIIKKICEMTLMSKVLEFFGERIKIHEVSDEEEKSILDYKVKFFDIRSTKAKQFGFVMTLHNGKRLTFCGDEPYQEHCHQYAYRTDYLLHEAFCLYSEKEKFKPYEKCHSTVKDAAELAVKLEVANLLLWHTEDKNIRRRKSLYKKEARAVYKGGLYVPYDYETIDL